MKTIRRIYLYVVCGFALPWLTFAVVSLLIELLLPGDSLGLTGIAFSLAVLVIAAPFYVSHWFLAERGALRDEDEATANVRQLYFFFVLTWLLGVLLALVYYFLYDISELILKPTRESWQVSATWTEVAELLIGILILTPLFVYHAITLRRDNTRHSETEFAAGLRRLFTFGYAAIGLYIFTVFLYNVIVYLGFAFRNEAGEIARITAVEIPRLLVSLALWLTLWIWAEYRFGANHPGEQESTLRKLYLYLSVFISVLIVVTNVVGLVAGWLAGLLNAPLSGDLLYVFASVIPSGFIWLYHAIVLRLDSRAAPATNRQITIQQLYRYQVAAIGFGAVLTGIGGLISILIELAFGSQLSMGTAVRQSLAWFTAGLVVGLVVWLPPFIQSLQASSGESDRAQRERNSIIRRIYFYFFILIASITVLSTGVYVLSQILGVVIGARTTNYLAQDLALAIAYLLIAIVVWVIHGFVVLNDNNANRKYQRQRLTEATIVLLSSGDTTLDQALQQTLTARLPELSPHWLPFAPFENNPVATPQPKPPNHANDALEDDPSPAPETPEALVARADLLLAPLSAFVNQPAAAEAWREQFEVSPAQKLLLATDVAGWRTPGLDRTSPSQIANLMVGSIQRFVDQETLEGRQTRTAGEIVAIIIGAIIGLNLFFLPLIFLLNMAGW